MTCYSCGVVVDGPTLSCSSLSSLHLQACQRFSTSPIPLKAPTLTLNNVHFALAQAVMLASASILIYADYETIAQGIHCVLIIISGISISVVVTVSWIDSSILSIFKGILNYIVPFFLPIYSGNTTKMLFFHLLLSCLTNILICGAMAHFHVRTADQPALSGKFVTPAHYATICINFSVLILSSAVHAYLHKT